MSDAWVREMLRLLAAYVSEYDCDDMTLSEFAEDCVMSLNATTADDKATLALISRGAVKS